MHGVQDSLRCLARRAVPVARRCQGHSPLGRPDRRAAGLVLLRRLRSGGRSGVGGRLRRRWCHDHQPGRANAWPISSCAATPIWSRCRGSTIGRGSGSRSHFGGSASTRCCDYRWALIVTRRSTGKTERFRSKILAALHRPLARRLTRERCRHDVGIQPCCEELCQVLPGHLAGQRDEVLGRARRRRCCRLTQRRSNVKNRSSPIVLRSACRMTAPPS